MAAQSEGSAKDKKPVGSRLACYIPSVDQDQLRPDSSCDEAAATIATTKGSTAYSVVEGYS